MDCSPPGSSVHGIHQARTLIVVVQLLSHVQLFVTPWTACPSLSFINSWSLLKLMSIGLVIASNHLVFCQLLLRPSIFPSIRVFSNESALHIRQPRNTGVGCHVLPPGDLPNPGNLSGEFFTTSPPGKPSISHS